MSPLAARGAPTDVDVDVDLRARALEIMRDERGAGDDANRRSSGILDVASDAFDDDELDEINLAQARVLMRDLPRVLAQLEGETTGSGRAEDGAAAPERDAERDARERDARDSERPWRPWEPSKGSALERLRALEDELRELLGERVVDEALQSVVETPTKAASAAALPGVVERAPSPPLNTIETRRSDEAEISTPAPRVALSLTPMPVEDSPEAKANFEPAMTSPKPAGGDDAPWDPYAAFMGVGREQALRPRSSAPPTPVSPPKARVLGLPVDASLTHETTLKLVADLEEKVKSKPIEYTRAPTNLYKDVVATARLEDEVVVEDVEDGDSGDEERRFTHQYTREDAATILELANEDDQIDSWSNAVAGDDLHPRAPPIVSPMMRGDNSTPSIAGVESMNEFKLMMESVFDEDD